MSAIGTRVDMRRLAEAVGMPGIDPSCWVSLARVDSDEDALSWEAGSGWIVDVTLHGGKLDGVPTTCRVASGFSSSNEVASCPVNLGDEVVVLLTDGDPNDSPVIVGRLANDGYVQVPAEIFGEVIDLALVRAAHLLVTDKDLKMQVGLAFRLDASDSAGLHAQAVTLADPEASQPFVRGDAYKVAMGAFLDATSTMATALATAFSAAATASTGPLVGLATPFTSMAAAVNAWKPAITALKNAIVVGNVLSERIKGE